MSIANAQDVGNDLSPARTIRFSAPYAVARTAPDLGTLLLSSLQGIRRSSQAPGQVASLHVPKRTSALMP